MGWKFKDATVTLPAEDWFLINAVLDEAYKDPENEDYPEDVARLQKLRDKVREWASDRVR